VNPKLLKPTAAETIALSETLGVDAMIGAHEFRVLLGISAAAFERWIKTGRVPQPDISAQKGGIRRWRLSVVRAFIAGEKAA
jgi:hypothetical protein